ncbi:MAG: MarR family transcriptional regulator [Methanobrevibacter sp.]|uniref:MarR family winged helix-turn-helix transcriptional regulator n=1 Tax=Methanobrevibacter sp. TaxID=66852 RepID=UPI0025D1F704|nr:MarR family transcriptional regulator [Methanobrevibacter sp.]MBQ6138168.1 MarR family transcriptional regulator [Methanobrevibacter sp.]
MRKDSVFNQEDSYLNSWYNITKGFGEFFKEKSANLKINPAEAMFLSKIYYKDGISQREIAHNLIVSEANITKTFKKLEEKELVYKTVDKENNARRNLHLTEKGIKTFEECIDIFGEFDVITFEGYSAEEKGRMEKQLKKISDKSLEIIK